MIDLIEQKYTFRLERAGEEICISTTEAVTLSEVLDTFERYLKACGFVLNGVLDVVPEEEV